MSLSYIRSLRKVNRASVTRIYNDRGSFSNYDAVYKQTMFGKLTKLQLDLNAEDESINSHEFEEVEGEASAALHDKLVSQMLISEGYQDKIAECLILLSPDTSAGPVTQTVDPVMPSRSILRQPTAPLPVFNSNENESFELFLEMFEETVEKYNYADCDKLLLIKQQITGKALYLIDSLEPRKRTYNEAKQLLLDAFASRPVQISNILKLMINLKLNYNGEPFKYLGEVRKIKQALESLTITTDEILNFFALNGLNDSFKN